MLSLRAQSFRSGSRACDFDAVGVRIPIVSIVVPFLV